MPFTAKLSNNKEVAVEAIDIGPVTGDHVEFFVKGRFGSSWEFLAMLCGHTDDRILRQLRYPDVDRVFSAFLDMLPQFVVQMIESGKIPHAGMDRIQDVSTMIPQGPAPAGMVDPATAGVPENLSDDGDDDGGGFDVGDNRS